MSPRSLPQSTVNVQNNPPKKRRRRPGRPLLSFAELAARKAARLSERANKHAPSSTLSLKSTPKKHGNASSPLEKLPVELLERVFLYALEINLCHASPYIAAAVSSERIYRTLIRLAFFRHTSFASANSSTSISSTAENAAARAKIREALKPADYKAMQLDDRGQAHLQATIMRCRWCTKQRIQNQLPALMQMTIQQHWVGANIALSDPVQQASLDELLEPRDSCNSRHAPTSIVEKGDIPPASSVLFRGTAPNGNNYYMSIIPLVSVSINCAEASVRDVHRVLTLRMIPDYLLRGRRSNHCYHRDDPQNQSSGTSFSFTDEDIDFLELLRHEYGFDGTGHDVSFSRNALQAGIKTALEARNARALSSLLKVDEFFSRRRLETASMASNPAGMGLLGGGGDFYAIPGDHFIRATQLPLPDSLLLFQLLLRCNAESLPADSSEITQWAMELSNRPSPPLSPPSSCSYTTTTPATIMSRKTSSQGPDSVHMAAFGRWLLDFMIDLPGAVDEARENPREKALFYYGAINGQTNRMGRRFLEEGIDCNGTWRRGELMNSWIQKVSFDVSKTMV